VGFITSIRAVRWAVFYSNLDRGWATNKRKTPLELDDVRAESPTFLGFISSPQSLNLLSFLHSPPFAHFSTSHRSEPRISTATPIAIAVAIVIRVMLSPAVAPPQQTLECTHPRPW
jgi:hypothetical protein